MKNKKKVFMLLFLVVFVSTISFTQFKGKSYELTYDNAIINKEDNSLNLHYEFENTDGLYLKTTDDNELVHLINSYDISSYLLTIDEEQFELTDYNADFINYSLEGQTTIDINIKSEDKLTNQQINDLTNEQFEIKGMSFLINSINGNSKLATQPYDCTGGGIIYSESVDQLQEINLFTGDVFIKNKITQELNNHDSAKVNALGYNENDGYVYGVDNVNKELLKIGSDGVSFYPLINAPKEEIQGGVIDVIGNNLVVVYHSQGRNEYGYISLSGSNIGTFTHVQDSDGRSVKYIGDLYYDKVTDEFYGIEISSTNIMKANYDRSNNTISTQIVKETGFNANISGIFGFGNKTVYVYDTSGRVYAYNIDTEEAKLISNTTSAGGDATYCGSQIGTDFGDAPDTYLTLEETNGPIHPVINKDVHLGEDVSIESSPVQPLDFTTDSFDDGVSTSGLIDEPTNSTNNITVNASKQGYISIWIDLNGNNTFDDATENVVQPTLINQGNNNINLGNLNFDDTMTEAAFRIRYVVVDNLADAQEQISLPTGIASNGEVEDYVFPIKEEANLTTTKEVTDASPYGNGDAKAQLAEQLHYTIKVENISSDMSSTNVQLVDTLPNELDLNTISNLKVSSTVNGENLINPINGITVATVGNTITINIDEIKANEVLYIQYDVLVKSNLTTTSPITNIVTTQDINKSYPDASSTIGIEGKTDYLVNKENINNEDGLASAGEVLQYKISVTNNGTLNIEDVLLSDLLIDENFDSLQLQSISKNGIELDETTGYDIVDESSVSINSFEVGSTLEIIINVTVKDPLANAQVSSIINQAKVCADLDASTQITEDECKKSPQVIVPFKTSFEILKENVDNEDGLATAGETLNYNIIVKNTSDVVIKNLGIVDNILDSNFINNSVKIQSVKDSAGNEIPATDYSINYNNTGIIINSINPNQKVVLKISVNIKDPLVNPSATFVSNQATACLGQCEYSNIVEVPFGQSALIKKENINNEDGLVSVGEVLQYKITVTNTSDIVVDQIKVIDQLSDANFAGAFDVVSIKDRNNNDVTPLSTTNNEIIFENVPPKEQYEIIINVKVKDTLDDTTATNVTNTAQVCVDYGTTCVDSNEVQISFEKDFEITKTNVNNDDNKASKDEVLYFDINVANTSDVDINNIVVSDVLDTNLEKLTFINITGKDGKEITSGYTISENELTVDTIEANEVYTIHISAEVKSTLVDPTLSSVKNTATAKYEDVAKDSNEVEVPFIKEYDISKQNINNADGFVQAGETLQYEVKLENNSLIDLENVVAKDLLTDVNFDKSTINLISIKDKSGNDISSSDYTVMSDSIKFNKVLANEIYTIVFEVDVTSPLKEEANDFVTNIATACVEENCINSNKVTIPFEYGSEDEEQFEIIKENVNNDDHIASKDETLYYDIIVSNTGFKPISNLTVTDLMSDVNFDKSSLKLIKVTNKSGEIVNNYTLGSNSIAFEQIPGKEQYIISIQIDVKDVLADPTVDSIKNVATGCVNKLCEESNEVELPLDPEVSITKKNINNDDNKADSGERLYYSLKVQNRGVNDLTNVKITDTFEDVNFDQSTIKVEQVLDNEGQLVDESEYVVDSATNQLTLNELKVNQSYEIILSVKVDEVLEDNTKEAIINKAQVCAGVDCISTPEEKVPFNIDYEIKKENINNEDGVVGAKETLQYNITVSNNSPIVLNGVQIVDLFTDNAFDINTINLVQIEDQNGNPVEDYTFNKLNGTVRFNMQPNTTYTITLSVKVLNSLQTDENYVANQAYICYGVDCKESNEVKTPFVQDFTITKSNIQNSDNLVESDEVLYYQISVTNTSPITINNLVVKDEFKNSAFLKDTLEIVQVVNSKGQQIQNYEVNGDEITLLSIPSQETFNIILKIQVKDKVLTTNKFVNNQVSACLSDLCKESEDVKIKIKTQLSINKVNINNEDSVAQEGEVLYYNIDVTNDSLNIQENISIEDKFGDQNFDLNTINIESVTTNGQDFNDYTVVDNSVVINSINPDQTIRITLSVKLNKNLVGDKVKNVATVCNEAKDVCEEATSEVTIIESNTNVVDPDEDITGGNEGGSKEREEHTLVDTSSSNILMVIFVIFMSMIFALWLRRGKQIK